MSYALNILDQSPVIGDQTNVEAFQQTIALAQMAERLGYKRFLLSEHHNLKGLIGTSPETLISHILAKTSTIRVGSAGVMLQHYSAFKVAENFQVLATLSPGRVDLGVGKTTGGLPYSTNALQKQFKEQTDPFDVRFKELYRYVHNEDELLIATPVPPIAPEIILLGASVESAKMATNYDVHLAFPRAISEDEAFIHDIVAQVKERKRGKLMMMVTVIASEDREEAIRLAGTYVVAKVFLQSGKVYSLQTTELAQTFGEQSNEPFEVKTYPAKIIAGTSEDIKKELDTLHKTFGVDEFILHTPVEHIEKRIKSFELLSPAKLFHSINA